MDPKELTIKSFTWNDVKVFLSVWEYQLGWLYVLLVEEETGEDYCDLSVFVKLLEKRNQLYLPLLTSATFRLWSKRCFWKESLI